jgi:hypothetical protein
VCSAYDTRSNTSPHSSPSTLPSSSFLHVSHTCSERLTIIPFAFSPFPREQKYASNNGAFLKDLTECYLKLTTLGYTGTTRNS